MKTKKPIKARRMVLLEYADGLEIFRDAKAAAKRVRYCRRVEGDEPRATQVSVINLSDIPALVEQVAHDLNAAGQIQGCKESAKTALHSLGLLIPARRRKK